MAGCVRGWAQHTGLWAHTWPSGISSLSRRCNTSVNHWVRTTISRHYASKKKRERPEVNTHSVFLTVLYSEIWLLETPRLALTTPSPHLALLPNLLSLMLAKISEPEVRVRKLGPYHDSISKLEVFNNEDSQSWWKVWEFMWLCGSRVGTIGEDQPSEKLPWRNGIWV